VCLSGRKPRSDTPASKRELIRFADRGRCDHDGVPVVPRCTAPYAEATGSTRLSRKDSLLSRWLSHSPFVGAIIRSGRDEGRSSPLSPHCTRTALENERMHNVMTIHLADELALPFALGFITVSAEQRCGQLTRGSHARSLRGTLCPQTISSFITTARSTAIIFGARPAAIAVPPVCPHRVPGTQ